jgi:hypothetical protein
MDADKSNKPTQTPGLKPPDPWKMVSLKLSKNWGDRRPQAGTEKQQHRWGEKGRLNLQTKEKKVEPQGKDDTAGQDCRARLPGKTAGQDCRARLPGKTAGQDCRARLPGKTARQDCRTAGQDCRAVKFQIKFDRV